MAESMSEDNVAKPFGLHCVTNLEGTTVRLLNRDCVVESFLGRGKSAYSWLVTDGEHRYVYKKMHSERVDHYTFSDKVLSEVGAWEKLRAAGSPVPRLLEWDADSQYLVKEYVEGSLASSLAARGALTERHFELAWRFHLRLRSAGLHVDYFPTNFVFRGADEPIEIFYIDYECHPYNQEWDFEHWGIYYWLNEAGMREHLEKGTTDLLNLPGTPKPITEPFEARKRDLLARIGSTPTTCDDSLSAGLGS